MSGEYTVALLAPNQAARAAALVARLRARVAELGLADDHLAVLDPGALQPAQITGPVAAIYFGGAARDAHATEVAATFVQRGWPLLPVVDDASGGLQRYADQMPRVVHGVNGFADDGSERALDSMTNTLLVALGLVRERRRVFISYRRAASTGVALQLAATLHAAGYLVFLDTESVACAAMFQRALWDAMADTDMVIFLDTPTTLDSRWVAEEFALANELGVTLLHLVWPGHVRPRVTELSEVMYLTAEDFWATAGHEHGDGKLRREAIGRVLTLVEHLRAAAFAARRRRLVEGFVARVKRTEGEVALDLHGRLRVKRRGDRDALIVPVIGALESMHIEEAGKAAGHEQVETRVLYRAHGMHPRRLQHLEWLDAHLPVKLLELEAVPRWLVSP